MTESPEASSRTIPLRVELIILVGALAVGCWLRGRQFFELGLSHHDEGVYAISSMTPVRSLSELLSVLVGQGLYSPPVFPLLGRLACFVLGTPTEFGVLLTSLTFSILMIPLLWWIGRDWWNASVGLLAAWLCAVDGMQILFGRCGLTDATFAFFFVASLWLGRRALTADSFRWAMLAGLFAGFTWNIKYNGFTVVVLLLGFVDWQRWREQVTRILVLGAVAAAVYLPWALVFHVKHSGGYSALTSHQAGYFFGPFAVASGWHTAWLNDQAVRNASTGIVAGLGTAAASISLSGLVLGSALTAVLASRWALVGWLPLALVGIASAGPSSLRRGALWSAAWLLVLPAMYTPYFRLWLPTESLGLLVAASGAVALAHFCQSTTRLKWAVAGVLVLLAVLAYAASPLDRLSPIPTTPAGYRPAALAIIDTAEQQRPRQIFALVRPPLRLCLAGIPVTYLSGEQLPASMQPGDWLLVDQSLTDAPQTFRTQVQTLHKMGQLQRVSELPVDASLPTLLDDHPGLVQTAMPTVTIWRLH